MVVAKIDNLEIKKVTEDILLVVMDFSFYRKREEIRG
jgi:hypothetical protein